MTSSGFTQLRNHSLLDALTGMRFFAAAVVLLSHFSQRGLIELDPAFIHYVDGGRTAVALFFVLSGFILTYNYSSLSGRPNRRTFYTNRIARIYPVSLLALALGAVGVLIAVMSPTAGYLESWYGLKSVDPVALAVSFFGQLTLTTGWLPSARLNQPWNGPAWSIACEMFFYALFPVIVAWLRDRRATTILVTLLAGFGAQVALVILFNQFAPIGARGFLVSQFPLVHLFDFVIGIAAGLFFLRGGREWLTQGHRRSVVLWSSIIAIVALSWWRPVEPAFLLLTPFFALFVFALAVTPSRGPSWLAHPLPVLLGQASFALYLIHVPLMNLYSAANPPPWAGWALVAATVLLSIGIFKFFESPARKMVKRVLSPRPKKPDDLVTSR